MKNIVKITAITLMLGVSMPAIAADDAAQRLGPRDTNADGKLSQDEFLAQQIERFNKIDKNGDGFVTKEEMDANKPKATPLTEEQKAKIQERRQKFKQKMQDAQQQ